jgi:hypothetical protein
VSPQVTATSRKSLFGRKIRPEVALRRQRISHKIGLAASLGAGKGRFQMEPHGVHRDAGALRIVLEVYAFEHRLHQLGGSKWNVQHLSDAPFGRGPAFGRVMDRKQDAALGIRKQVVA